MDQPWTRPADLSVIPTIKKQMQPQEIAAIVAIIIIVISAIWVILGLWMIFGLIYHPKNAKDDVRETTLEDVLKLWEKGYSFGFSEKALIPVKFEQVPSTKLLDLSKFTQERLMDDLQKGHNCILGKKHGAVYREENSSPDPVTRYLDSISSICDNCNKFSVDRAAFMHNFDMEFIPHIAGLTSDVLAKLLRDKRITSRIVYDAIHNEAIARILEKL